MVIVWRVTERCNLGCPFCAYDRTVQGHRREAGLQGILDFGPVLADYTQSTGDKVLVSWIGGEPLLWPPVFSATRAFAGLPGVTVSTTTNGTPLSSPEVRRLIIEEFAELTVSVDGTGDLHDRLRGWNGGYDRLRSDVRTLAGEKKAAGTGPLLRANAVLMRETIDGFGELCADLASWGFDEVTFNRLGGNDRPDFYRDHRLLPGQADRFAAELPALRARLAAAGIRLRGGREYIRRIQAASAGDRIAVTDCSPGRAFLFIDERGMVAPCSFTVQDCGVPIKKIRSGADLGGLSRIFAESIGRKRPAGCGDCYSNQVFEKFQEA